MSIDISDPRVRWAQFGKQVEMWLDTDIGRYLVSRAENDVNEAIEKLKIVDALDSKAVMAAQNRVVIAEKVLGWLGDAIREGHSSLESLKEEERSE